MGYELHVTRRSDWTDDDGDAISQDEWLAYVESDPTMRLDGYAEAETTDGRVLRVESPGLAVWTAYSGHGVDGGMAWFDLSFHGNVIVKNPDAEIIGKMLEVAGALAAGVQGDDGEWYTEDNIEELMASPPEHRRRRDIPWWRRLLGR
jgi:hypothetical protein